MGGPQEARLVMLVEKAHPRRMARASDEWMRCANILDEAATSIQAAAMRHTELGGRTGPAMRDALTLAIDVLQVKVRDLRRGGDALLALSDATHATQEEKRRLDREHPDDGRHAELRETGSFHAATSQESAMKHGIAVMKSIRTGDDPRGRSIPSDPPSRVDVRMPSWWPPLHPDPGPHHHTPLHPGDPQWDHEDDHDLPGSPQSSGPRAPAAPARPGVLGTPSAPAPAGLPGPGSLAATGLGVGGVTAGVTAGVRATTSALPASEVRPIGAGGSTGSSGTLGRSGSTGVGGTAGGRGGGTAGGRGRRSRDRERRPERDLIDDGEDWLDDHGVGPDVLR